jgi:hypothetical protein
MANDGVQNQLTVTVRIVSVTIPVSSVVRLGNISAGLCFASCVHSSPQQNMFHCKHSGLRQQDHFHSTCTSQKTHRLQHNWLKQGSDQGHMHGTSESLSALAVFTYAQWVLNDHVYVYVKRMFGNIIIQAVTYRYSWAQNICANWEIILFKLGHVRLLFQSLYKLGEKHKHLFPR